MGLTLKTSIPTAMGRRTRSFLFTTHSLKRSGAEPKFLGAHLKLKAIWLLVVVFTKMTQQRLFFHSKKSRNLWKRRNRTMLFTILAILGLNSEMISWSGTTVIGKIGTLGCAKTTSMDTTMGIIISRSLGTLCIESRKSKFFNLQAIIIDNTYLILNLCFNC